MRMKMMMDTYSSFHTYTREQTPMEGYIHINIIIITTTKYHLHIEGPMPWVCNMLALQHHGAFTQASPYLPLAVHPQLHCLSHASFLASTSSCPSTTATISASCKLAFHLSLHQVLYQWACISVYDQSILIVWPWPLNDYFTPWSSTIVAINELSLQASCVLFFISQQQVLCIAASSFNNNPMTNTITRVWCIIYSRLPVHGVR